MPDEGYKILEHPADFEVVVFGLTKKHLFENAMQAMAHCLDAEVTEEKAEEKIRVLSEDREALLVDFLNEVNYLSEVKMELYEKVSFSKFTDTEIVAVIYGKKVKRFGLQVKAATFHDLRVEKKDEGWRAHIIFDV